MGVRILNASDRSCMFCSTTDWAFGPVFYDTKEHEHDERLLAFLRWMGKRDPRAFTDKQMETLYSSWLKQEDEQWARELKEAQEDLMT